MTTPRRVVRRRIGVALSCALALFATAWSAVTLLAQTSVGAATDGPPFARIVLTVGRSNVLMTDFDVKRIAVTNPAIADALVITDREVLIDGKTPGTVSLILWGSDRRVQYDVAVELPVSNLQQQVRALFPGEDIRVSSTDDAVVLSGRVSTNEVSLRAAELAQASATKLKVINWLQGPGAVDSQQVMLQVRFAEVSRNALDELGATLLALRPNFYGRSTTQQFAAPDFDATATGGLRFRDFANLFYFSTEGWGAVVRALEQRGDFQSLAEPNLIAYNGQEASFLAGGELPIPVVQGVGATSAVTVLYKEFGVRLTFRPTITGDLIRLHVRPEVSQPDFANGVQLGGMSIPALTTRRAETDVELRDGQSFVIAGLLNNTSRGVRDAIPLLSKLPILGQLFKSQSDRAELTELLVLITPRLVRPLEPGEVPPLPVDPKGFIKRDGDLGSLLQGGGGLVDAPVPASVVGDTPR